VIDIADPAAARLTAVLDTPYGAWDLAVAGTHAYVADYQAGLQIFDIADPSHPQAVGSIDTPGNAWDVAVTGPLACVADGDHGLTLIDIANPARPRLAGRVPIGGRAVGVAADGDHAYVASGGSSDLFVISIASPSAPKIVAAIPTPGGARDVAVMRAPSSPAGAAAGGTRVFVYVADERAGLQVIDATTPESPRVIGGAATGGSSGVAVSSAAGIVALASGKHGLQLFPVQCAW
jgi:hypothetical protein